MAAPVALPHHRQPAPSFSSHGNPRLRQLPCHATPSFSITCSRPISWGYDPSVVNTVGQVVTHRLTCKAYNNDVSVSVPMNTEWFQKVIELQPYRRGCHIITDKIYRGVPEIREFEVGLANLFVMHTSASLTINENASPDVPLDMEDALNKIVPEGHHYRHLDEGLDDMPAHVKSSMMGCSLTVPIRAGRLSLGIWQGIWLNEHRNYGGPRTICITIQGLKRSDGRTYM